MLAANPDATVAAAKPVRILHRSNVRPDALLGIEFPNCAIGHAARPDAIAIDQVECALRIEGRVNGQKIRRLSGNRLPGFARVGAAEKMAVSAVRGANVNRLSRFAASSGAGVEYDETQPRAAASASAATAAPAARSRAGNRIGWRIGRGVSYGVGGKRCRPQRPPPPPTRRPGAPPPARPR